MFDRPELTIHLFESSLFLRPSPDPEHIPSEDPVLQGTVVVRLPKAKRIKSVCVSLKICYELRYPNVSREVKEETISKVLYQTNTPEGRSFSKGEHMFSFAIIVPSSIAPFERSQFGSVDHVLVATVQGDGLLGSDITTKIPVVFVVNPAGFGEVYDLTLYSEGFNEHIGVYALSTSSQHLTVGGLIAFSLTFSDLPHHINIISIAGYINSSYSLYSMEDFHTVDSNQLEKTIPCRRASKKATIFFRHAKLFSASDVVLGSEVRNEMGEVLPRRSGTGFRQEASSLGLPFDVAESDHLYSLESGGSYHLEYLTRLPKETTIQPSTRPGTKTPVHVEHELVFEVKFQLPDEPDKKLLFKVSKPIVIASCRCMVQSLLVPVYSDDRVPSSPSISSPMSRMESSTSTATVASSSSSLGSASTSSSSTLVDAPCDPKIPQNGKLAKAAQCACQLSNEELLAELPRLSPSNPNEKNFMRSNVPIQSKTQFNQVDPGVSVVRPMR